MKLQLDAFGQYKNYIHMFQGVVLFLAWALTITVLTRPGDTDGRVGWYFGLVCSSQQSSKVADENSAGSQYRY